MALAFDTATTANLGSGTTKTYNHTCTGTNRLLLVGFTTDIDTTDVVTSVTYNGVAMTRVTTLGAASERSFLYVLANPASGINAVAINLSIARVIVHATASYMGAKQSGQPDASNTNTNTTANLSTAVTTVADNSWVVLYARNTAVNIDAGTSTTMRTANTNPWGIFDSNAAKTPAGSMTLQTTGAGGGTWQHVAASIAPFAVATATRKGIQSLISLQNIKSF